MCRESNHLVTLCLYKNSREREPGRRAASQEFHITRRGKRNAEKGENGGGLNMGLSVCVCVCVSACICVRVCERERLRRSAWRGGRKKKKEKERHSL